jgi:hypothetical protein
MAYAMRQPFRGWPLANNPGQVLKIATPNPAPKADKPVALARSKGLDKFGFALSGKRSFAATLYAKKGGATTAAVKAATFTKYGKGYPMLNMLRKLDSTSKKWCVVTTLVANKATGRTVKQYAIVARS